MQGVLDTHEDVSQRNIGPKIAQHQRLGTRCVPEPWQNLDGAFVVCYDAVLVDFAPKHLLVDVVPVDGNAGVVPREIEHGLDLKSRCRRCIRVVSLDLSEHDGMLKNPVLVVPRLVWDVQHREISPEAVPPRVAKTLQHGFNDKVGYWIALVDQVLQGLNSIALLGRRQAVLASTRDLQDAPDGAPQRVTLCHVFCPLGPPADQGGRAIPWNVSDLTHATMDRWGQVRCGPAYGAPPTCLSELGNKHR
ncbi:MAG: hypothetical protein R2722_16460 [Tessaracoccus sp.]